MGLPLYYKEVFNCVESNGNGGQEIRAGVRAAAGDGGALYCVGDLQVFLTELVAQFKVFASG
jgi:hypothetical protein